MAFIDAEQFLTLVKTEVRFFHIKEKGLSYEFAYPNMVLYFMSTYGYVYVLITSLSLKSLVFMGNN